MRVDRVRALLEACASLDGVTAPEAPAVASAVASALERGTLHPDDLIESIRWENRPVGVITPKGRVGMKKDCLVIRSRYLDGQPVYIGLKEKSERLRVGSEHRFYERGGKCTAVFYDLPVALEEVDIVAIPVARFKEAEIGRAHV